MTITVSCQKIQLLSCVWLFVTPWTAACQASLSFTILSQGVLINMQFVNLCWDGSTLPKECLEMWGGVLDGHSD